MDAHILKKTASNSILALSDFRRQSIFASFFLLSGLPDTASALTKKIRFKQTSET